MKASTTGNEKTRVSIAFCAAADRSKLCPVILIPRKRPLKDYTPPTSVIIALSTNCNFNSEVICENFCKRSHFPYIDTHRIQRPTLIIDSVPCYKKKRFKSHNKFKKCLA